MKFKFKIARMQSNTIERSKKDEVDCFELLLDEVESLEEECKEIIYDVFMEHLVALKEFIIKIKKDLCKSPLEPKSKKLDREIGGSDPLGRGDGGEGPSRGGPLGVDPFGEGSSTRGDASRLDEKNIIDENTPPSRGGGSSAEGVDKKILGQMKQLRII